MFMDYDSVMSCGRSGSCSQNKTSDRCSDVSGYGCEKKSDCSAKHSWGLENYPLAMVYSPLQKFDNLFDIDTALNKGTLFCELDLPFMGESVYNSGKGGCCRG